VNYRVRFTPKGTEALRLAALPREVIVQACNRLHNELGADPDHHLRERIVPLDLFSYRFTISLPPKLYFCMFAVQRLDDTKELRVVGGSFVSSFEADEDSDLSDE